MELRHFMLQQGGSFSIPACWWIEAGMERFERGSDCAYRGRQQLNSSLYRIQEIQPPPMDRRGHLSHSGLDQARMAKVFREIAGRMEIWPVEITEMDGGNFAYGLHEGAHRYFASVAAGFTHIPALVVLR
jgi:hypothetical protein